jgi:hypothetical protein
MTATWIPYNALQHGGCCEVCKQPATWALVKLHTGIAFDLVRIVCDAHRPDVGAAASGQGPDDDPWKHLRRRPR